MSRRLAVVFSSQRLGQNYLVIHRRGERDRWRRLAGMICSESELGIGEGEGIFICGADIDAAPGTPVVEALQLRDTVFDLGVTPNRPDCLGHRGLAREICLLFDHPYTPAEIPLGSFEPESVSVPEHGEVRVTISAPELCPGYAASVVTGISVGPSPFWLQYRLHSLGVRPISTPSM